MQSQFHTTSLTDRLPWSWLSILVLLFLGSALILPPVAPYEAVYVTLVGLTALFIYALINARSMLFTAGAKLHLAGFAFIILATIPHALNAPNWLGAGILAISCLGVGLPVLARLTPRLSSSILLCLMCLLGAIIGAGLGIVDVLSGVGRAGAGNNPIHYSGIVVVLGFCALGGLFADAGKYRIVFILGPVAGFIAALASGSRGPLLAAIGLTAIAWLLSAIWWRRSKAFWGLSLLGGLALTVLLLVTADGMRAFVGLIEALKGDTINSSSYADDIRATLYWGGFQAFLDSPLWGHGYANLMDAAALHMPDDTRYTRYDHLHSDLIDFLVVGGVLGGLSYLALLFGPLMSLRLFKRPEARTAIMMAVMLSASYALLGLTNAMIGILPQTVLFAVLSGCVFMLDQKITA